MKTLFATLGLVLALAFTTPVAQAQQINPTAKAVTEDSLFNALKPGEQVTGRITIPDDQAAGLIKPDNKGWAATHTTTVRSLTIYSMAGILILLAVFFAVRGRIRIEAGPSGRTITRFSGIDRFAHWLMAGSFVVLALTGMNLVLGRTLLLPLVGEGRFGTLTAYGKIAHNYVGWAFMIGLLLSFLLWVGRNLPRAHDMTWLAMGGGLLKKGVHPPAGKFNAGQKLIFWAVTLGGIALSVTGYFLLFPGVAGTQADWQFYQLVHGIVSALLTAIIIAHIYIGSVGMEGAFDAMGSGEVDLNWAKEHHALWVKEVQGNAGASGGRSAAPAE
ncbi:MAG: formate dehydrogenase subunit gamma [Gemmobacter sp.]